MNLYQNLKKFDKLVNPSNNKIYYITERKATRLHPLTQTYNLEEAWEIIKHHKNKIIRLKKSESELEMIDVDTDDIDELEIFLNKIKNYKYVKIQSQKPNHFHIFFKKSKELKKPVFISKNIAIWEDWVRYFNTPISMGADLPNYTNGRKFVEIPDTVDELPEFIININK